MGLLVTATVAIDSSKLKAIGMVERRRAHLELGVARYLSQLDTADRQEPSEALATKTTRLKENFANEMRCLDGIEARMLSTPDQQISFTDPDAHSMATSGRGSGVVGYNVRVAVDTEHHLIVTQEATKSAPTTRSWRVSPKSTMQIIPIGTSSVAYRLGLSSSLRQL
jgi:hypothetical protein